MSTKTIASVYVHLRARSRDKMMIDQAAEWVGTSGTQFISASALEAAKAVLLDQSTIHADAEAFQRIMEWMAAAPTATEDAGMKRLLAAAQPG